MTDLVVGSNDDSNNNDNKHSIISNKLIVSIPEFSTSQEHTVYYINVSYEQINWTIFRRYSQFNELNESLILFDKSIKTICTLPTKTYLSPNPKGKAFLNKRREGLEKYLHALKKIQDIETSLL